MGAMIYGILLTVAGLIAFGCAISKFMAMGNQDGMRNVNSMGAGIFLLVAAIGCFLGGAGALGLMK